MRISDAASTLNDPSTPENQEHSGAVHLKPASNDTTLFSVLSPRIHAHEDDHHLKSGDKSPLSSSQGCASVDLTLGSQSTPRSLASPAPELPSLEPLDGCTYTHQSKWEEDDQSLIVSTFRIITCKSHCKSRQAELTYPSYRARQPRLGPSTRAISVSIERPSRAMAFRPCQDSGLVSLVSGAKNHTSPI